MFFCSTAAFSFLFEQTGLYERGHWLTQISKGIKVHPARERVVEIILKQVQHNTTFTLPSIHYCLLHQNDNILKPSHQ
jgi:hypothetical protein